MRDILICSSLGLLTSNVSFAYDPGSHQKLTELASNLITDFRAPPDDSNAAASDAAALGVIERVDADEGERSSLIGPLDYDLEYELGNVALSTKKEDIDPRRAADRLRYWHFFSAAYYPENFSFDEKRENPHGATYDYVADVVIERIQNNINEMVENGEHCAFRPKDIAKYSVTNRDDLFFERLGRGVHFIQDATVPAHVVPVYHGPWLPRSGEGLPTGAPIHDPIDSYPIEEGVQEGIVVPPTVFSTTLLHDIIQRNIAETLHDLAQPISPGSYGNLTWGYFFQRQQGKNFFGTYKVLAARQRAFDPTTFRAIVSLPSHHQVQIPEHLVRAFVGKIHRRAIASTAQYMHSEITRYFAGKCAAKIQPK